MLLIWNIVCWLQLFKVWNLNLYNKEKTEAIKYVHHRSFGGQRVTWKILFLWQQFVKKLASIDYLFIYLFIYFKKKRHQEEMNLTIQKCQGCKDVLIKYVFVLYRNREMLQKFTPLLLLYILFNLMKWILFWVLL